MLMYYSYTPLFLLFCLALAASITFFNGLHN
ncbi:hypothetical protein SAMN05216288_1164 [Pseudomonas punonensis]|uniref:Uncharacterized protein n=1 Tax=Phytopseudomonas punonensis TaxID=1220495 RepID=A0A1M6Y7V6_9GAMM|nr:hypothetical protein SAMN05216288_1164 [Pseudomonas punonensis]